MLGTGIRFSEFSGLRRYDIHGDYFIIIQTICRNRNFDEDDLRRISLQVSIPITKAGRRAIPLTPKLKEILDVQRKRQQELKEKAGNRWQPLDLVFTTEVGTPYEGHNMTRTLYRILRQEGIEQLGLHALRHPYVKLKTKLLIRSSHRFEDEISLPEAIFIPLKDTPVKRVVSTKAKSLYSRQRLKALAFTMFKPTAFASFSAP